MRRMASFVSLAACLLACLSLPLLGCSDDGGGEGETGESGESSESGGSDASLPEDFLTSLTKLRGCSDVKMAASNEAGTVAISFNGDAIAEQAHMAGEEQVRVTELPADEAQVRLQLGMTLDEICTDTGDGPQVETQWRAVSGTVTLTVNPVGAPEGPNFPCQATLELSNLSFEAEGLDSVLVESFTIDGISVGSFPG